MEFKDEEQVVLSVLEIKVELKEEEEEEQVIWWVLEIEVEFKEEEEEEQVVLSLLEVEVEFQGGKGDLVGVGDRGGVQGGAATGDLVGV